jgi:predicted helicase
VLILDPATGTATFLYTVLDFIRSQFKTKKNAGQWSSYVHEHLLPRLFGFELLMAPYAVAHFKIGLALAAMDEEPLFRQQWSYEPQGNERVNIFLTNTLEDLEHTAEQLGPLRALSNEANSAFEVKRHKPVLVVLGNPPYSGHSANTGEWISKLVRDYYFCDGQPLGERNPKWLQDDYVKFLRWGQWRIEQTGQGILAFITNHGYLDNPTFRGMRQNLIQTFDEIYVLDLHGNSKKLETVPDTGAPDKNVFDIRQGVAIGIFVKLPPDTRANKKPKGPASVRHCHLWGAHRQLKYDWLGEHHVENTDWTTLAPVAPHYLLIPQDTKRFKEYERGWKVTEIMPVTVIGPNSHRDGFSIAFTYAEALSRLKDLANPNLSPEEFLRRYKLKENADWTVRDARAHNLRQVTPLRCVYRPFDERYMLWGPFAFDRPRQELISHLLSENIGLVSTRQTKELFSVFSTRWPVGQHKLATPYDGSYVSPLYLYPNGKLPDEDLFAHDNGRRPNLSATFVQEFCARLDCKFVPAGLGRAAKREVGPEGIFNYAYAVFHSPTYRDRYAEFLRADFPRLPLTGNWDLFQLLASFGLRLVNLHARDEGDGNEPSFPIKGENLVGDVRYEPPQGKVPGRVWINAIQYFDDVPEAVWQFPIGGYLPAQRWLKDRKQRKLSFEEIGTYTRIVFALAETRKLMAQIDAAIEKHGGWPLQ